MNRKLFNVICFSALGAACILSGCHSGQTGSGQNLDSRTKSDTQIQNTVGENEDNPEIICPDDDNNGCHDEGCKKDARHRLKREDNGERIGRAHRRTAFHKRRAKKEHREENREPATEENATDNA